MKTLKDVLDEWSSRERAMFGLGRCLGVFESNFEEAREMLRDRGHVANTLEFALQALAVRGVLEYDAPSDQYRWKPSYTWRKE